MFHFHDCFREGNSMVTACYSAAFPVCKAGYRTALRRSSTWTLSACARLGTGRQTCLMKSLPRTPCRAQTSPGLYVFGLSFFRCSEVGEFQHFGRLATLCSPRLDVMLVEPILLRRMKTDGDYVEESKKKKGRKTVKADGRGRLG
ncbi:unnamed protein product [Durusdinium trenchii]|uniref:Uncharacterized protein n=1 Tax=Durusdinium trenchii TaxID=1381693 RepID=A0ABP0HWH6_9DINO